MRICFLANGTRAHTYNWIQYFAKKGHQIHLISLDGNTFEPLENLTVYSIEPVIPFQIKFLSTSINLVVNSFKIKRLVRTINPDIVHAHYLTDYGFIGYLIHFPIFVVTIWGSDILIAPKKSYFLRVMAKYILNSSTLITGDSNLVKNECLNYCNQPEKVKVILWGVDLSLFHEKRTDQGERTQITILSTRGFAPVYNIDIIENSIPLVIKKYTNVKYVLKSEGDRDCTLEQLAKFLNVTEFVKFVYNKIDYKKFLELYDSADIFVSVPSSDSSSVSLFEAMASGLPVIVSDIPANHEWITDGWNGLIVPAGNQEKLAEAIIRMIENPVLMRLFGQRNAQLIRDKADRDKHMAQMEDLYRQLLEKK